MKPKFYSSACGVMLLLILTFLIGISTVNACSYPLGYKPPPPKELTGPIVQIRDNGFINPNHYIHVKFLDTEDSCGRNPMYFRNDVFLATISFLILLLVFGVYLFKRSTIKTDKNKTVRHIFYRQLVFFVIPILFIYIANSNFVRFGIETIFTPILVILALLNIFHLFILLSFLKHQKTWYYWAGLIAIIISLSTFFWLYTAI